VRKEDFPTEAIQDYEKRGGESSACLDGKRRAGNVADGGGRKGKINGRRDDGKVASHGNRAP